MRTSFLLISLLWCLGTAQAGEVGVAARVNDVEISNFRLERYFTEFLAAHGRSVGAIRDPRTYRRLRRAALDELIDKELLCQSAKKQGLEVDEDAVQAHFKQVRDAFRAREDFTLRLELAGFDEAEYLEYLRREQLARRMLERLSRVEPVSQDDVESLLRENPPLSAGSQENEQRARELLTSRRQADAARAALLRLREENRVEVLAYGL